MNDWEAEDFYDDFDPSEDEYGFDYHESETEQKQVSHKLILKLRRASTISYLRGIVFESTNVSTFEDACKQAIDFVTYKYPGWKISDYRSADGT